MNDEHDDIPPDVQSAGGYSVKRREERYAVPAVYQRYITTQIKAGAELVQVTLGNFSRHGILFESSVHVSPGSQSECVISIPLLLSKDIIFGIHIRYCFNKENSFIVGASIETVADATWFDVFVEIHDFIMLRRDIIY